MEFDKSDVRKLMYFLYMEGNKATNIADRINKIVGEGTTTARSCQRWVEKFKNGQFSSEDKERSGRPSFQVDDQISECLSSNRHGTTTTTIGKEIGVSKETVRKRLLASGKKYLCNRWLPHSLSNENRANRERICGVLINKFRNNNFLSRIVTVDEAWVYWTNDRTYHNRSWFGSGDTPNTSVMRSPMTNKKFLATVFWDSKGLLLLKVLPQGQSITSNVYCEYLDNLATSIRQKRRRPCSDHFFIHDNARPHTARQTVDKLNELGFDVLPHPPYSLDLNPSDYYLFHPMKNAL